MRGLTSEFMRELREGFLRPLLDAVVQDRDLLLEIREDYLNVYFKGHSLLRLARDAGGYPVTQDCKFQVAGLCHLPRLTCRTDTKAFVHAMPAVKQRILKLGPSGNEIEYEQQLIRANNCEPRLHTDYVIIDRQLTTVDRKGRFDLLGVHWPRSQAREAPLVLFEVKYGLNQDIQYLHRQLRQYYEAAYANVDSIADEAECLLRQKLDLGLFCLPKGQPEALQRVRIRRVPDTIRFGVVLVDYDPASRLLDRALPGVAQLPFAERIAFFHAGFGLWRARGGSPHQDWGT